jgi:hypothetical protein
MAYTKSARPYKHEYEMQVKRGEHENRMERQRARRKLDAKGVDRTGKDIDHKVMLSKGGSNADGIRLVPPSKNRARNGQQKTKK